MKNLLFKGLIFMCLTCFIGIISGNAQYSVNQNKIEAIIQLAKFVDWSQNRTFSDQKRTLYILSNNENIINKDIPQNYSIYKNWTIKYCENLSQVTNGSVIFITKSQKNSTKKVINHSKNNDIMTISDNMDFFCRDGGMINLIEEGNTIKFEINYRLIQNKSLEISSKVLALAKIYD